MKLVNKDGKLFGKINIIDILVVLLIVAAAVFAVVKMTDFGGSESMPVAKYEFKMEKVRMQTVEAWSENAMGIIDAENKTQMGDIVNISYEPARELVQKSDGSYCISEHSDRYDVTLTLQANVKETEKGYYTLDNTYIAPGKTMGLSNGYAQTFGEIISLEIK